MNFNKMLSRIDEASKLNEGPRFGEKEKSKVLSDTDMFKIGFEYEFHPHNESWYDEALNIKTVKSEDDLRELLSYSQVSSSDVADEYGYIMDDSPMDNGTWRITYGDYKLWVNADTREVFDENGAVTYEPMEALLLEVFNITLGNNESLFDKLFDLSAFILRLKSFDESTLDMVEDLGLFYTDEGEELLSLLLKGGDSAAKTLGDLLFSLNRMVMNGSDELSSDNQVIINDILDNSSDFKLKQLNIRRRLPIEGIIYERVNEPPITLMIDVLKKHDIAYRKITTDNDRQVEIITEPLSVPEALINLKKMLALIDHYGYTSEKSGLHISISSNEYSLSEINFEKLFFFLNFGFIHQSLYTPRSYVSTSKSMVDVTLEGAIASNIDQILDMVYKGKSSIDIINWVYQEADISNTLRLKHQSLNIGDYHILDGRIELRYFGGTDYQKGLDKIIQEMTRSLNILKVSYNTKYDTDFKKIRAVYFDRVLEGYLGISFGEVRKLVKMIIKHASPDTIDAVLNRPEFKPMFDKQPNWGKMAFKYASKRNIIQ